MFAAKFRHVNAVFGLLQDAQDLVVGVAGRLHVKSPRPGLRENSTFQNQLFPGGLPADPRKIRKDHQRLECDPLGQELHGPTKGLCWPKLLGSWILRFNRRAG